MAMVRGVVTSEDGKWQVFCSGVGRFYRAAQLHWQVAFSVRVVCLRVCETNATAQGFARRSCFLLVP